MADELPGELRGLKFNAPPADRLGALSEAAKNVQLSPGRQFALVALFNEKGVNGAVILSKQDLLKKGDKLDTSFWIGKEYKGSLNYQGKVQYEW